MRVSGREGVRFEWFVQIFLLALGNSNWSVLKNTLTRQLQFAAIDALQTTFERWISDYFISPFLYIYICRRSLFCCNFHTQIILRLKPKLHWHGQSGHFLLWQIEPNSSGLCGRHFDCATPLAQQTICCWLVLVPRPFYLSSFFMLFLCNLFACGKTNQLSCLPLGKRERVTESNAELHSMAITAPAKEASLVRVSIFRGAGSPCIQGTFMRECFLEIIL